MEAVIKLEERKERDEDFVREYVNNGDNAIQAAVVNPRYSIGEQP